MKPGKRVFSTRGQLAKIGKYRTVSLKNDQFLGLVPPPSVRVGEVLDQFSGGLVEHIGAGPGLESRVADPVNPATLDILIQTIVFDRGMNEGAFWNPGGFLDDTAVHVYNVEGAIRSGCGIDRSEIGIRTGNELVFRISIVKYTAPHRICLNRCPPGQAPHGFVKE